MSNSNIIPGEGAFLPDLADFPEATMGAFLPELEELATAELEELTAGSEMAGIPPSPAVENLPIPEEPLPSVEFPEVGMSTIGAGLDMGFGEGLVPELPVELTLGEDIAPDLMEPVFAEPELSPMEQAIGVSAGPLVPGFGPEAATTVEIPSLSAGVEAGPRLYRVTTTFEVPQGNA